MTGKSVRTVSSFSCNLLASVVFLLATSGKQAFGKKWQLWEKEQTMILARYGKNGRASVLFR